jgi:hypothetical protein
MKAWAILLPLMVLYLGFNKGLSNCRISVLSLIMHQKRCTSASSRQSLSADVYLSGNDGLIAALAHLNVLWLPYGQNKGT